VEALMIVALLCSGRYQLATQVPASSKPAPKITAADAKPAPIDPAKEATIRKLLLIQGTAKIFDQVIATMSETIRPQITSALPAGGYRDTLVELFLTRFKTKFRTEQMIDIAVPIYDKHFSKAEIEDLVQFYSTPLGKKVVSVLPQVMTESQSAGIKLGEKYGQEAMTEVLAEHPELKKALEAATAEPPKR